MNDRTKRRIAVTMERWIDAADERWGCGREPLHAGAEVDCLWHFTGHLLRDDLSVKGGIVGRGIYRGWEIVEQWILRWAEPAPVTMEDLHRWGVDLSEDQPLTPWSPGPYGVAIAPGAALPDVGTFIVWAVIGYALAAIGWRLWSAIR
jgi:hypothetical protein